MSNVKVNRANTAKSNDTTKNSTGNINKTGEVKQADNKNNLVISGTNGKTYNLDEITAENRYNSSKPLIVQVYEYKTGESPNPKDVSIGQIWLSKKID